MARTNITDLPGLPELKAANGYVTLPGGVIIQWGKLTGVTFNQTFHPVTFPVPFPNAVRSIQATLAQTAFVSGNLNTALDSASITTTGFDAGVDFDSVGSSTGDIHWIAIGY